MVLKVLWYWKFYGIESFWFCFWDCVWSCYQCQIKETIWMLVVMIDFVSISSPQNVPTVYHRSKWSLCLSVYDKPNWKLMFCLRRTKLKSQCLRVLSASLFNSSFTIFPWLKLWGFFVISRVVFYFTDLFLFVWLKTFPMHCNCGVKLYIHLNITWNYYLLMISQTITEYVSSIYSYLVMSPISDYWLYSSFFTFLLEVKILPFLWFVRWSTWFLQRRYSCFWLNVIVDNMR